MATHSSSLVWEMPWTEEPGGLQSGPLGHRVRHDLATENTYYFKLKGISPEVISEIEEKCIENII